MPPGLDAVSIPVRPGLSLYPVFFRPLLRGSGASLACVWPSGSACITASAVANDRASSAALALGCVALTASILAAVGAVPLVDHMTHRVLALVDTVPWSRWWAPLWMPAPIEAWSLRPGAVLLTKAHAALGGVLVPPSVWTMRVGAAVSGTTFGVGAWVWLRAHGFGRLALPAAVAPLLLAPTLFSLWYVVEFDALGAGLLLLGSGLLAPSAVSRARFGAGAAILVGTVLLKESSALLVFAFLCAEACLAWFDGQRAMARRVGGLLAALLLGYLGLASSVIGSGDSVMARTSFVERLPILELNAHQYVYLVGSAGAVLVVLGPLLRRWPTFRARLAVVGLLALMAVPPLTFYSHYEAVYYTPRWVASLLGFGLLAALCGNIIEQGVPRPVRHASAALVVAYGAVSVASLLASSAREDIAARTLLACAPLLCALALGGLRTVLEPAAGGVGRLAGLLLGAAFAWYPVAGAVDFSQDWLARQYTESTARRELAQEPLTDSILAFNHYVQWVGPDELRAVGAPAAIADRTVFVQTHAFLGEESLPIVVWGEGSFDLERGWEQGVPMRLYWLAMRSDMDAAANEALRGDLTWTRRPVGLFTPLGDDGDGGPSGTAVGHNLPEDMLWTTYRPAPTPLERLTESRAQVAWAHEVPFIQVPRDLLAIPRRLVAGIPLWERYHYEARLHRFVSPTGAQVQTPDVAMTDSAAAARTPWAAPVRNGGGPGYLPPVAGNEDARPAVPSDKPLVPMGTERRR